MSEEKYSKNYLSWVKSERDRCEKMKIEFKPLTGSQYRLAEWLFANWDCINQPGDLTRIFDSVSYFIKHSPDFQKTERRPKILKILQENQYDFDYGYGKTGPLHVRMVDRNKASFELEKLFKNEK